MTISVFSDVSQRHRAIGYFWVALDDGWQCEGSGDLTDLANVTAAEIAALALAIGFLPPQRETVAAFTDLADLPGMMVSGRRTSWQPRVQRQLDELHAAARRHKRVEWRLVDRKNLEYRRCHKLARAAAIRAVLARRMPFLDPSTQRPKVKAQRP